MHTHHLSNATDEPFVDVAAAADLEGVSGPSSSTARSTTSASSSASKVSGSYGQLQYQDPTLVASDSREE